MLVCIAFGNESDVPTSFDKVPFSYKLLKSVVVDLDKMFKEIGIDTQACRIISMQPQKSYAGAGMCLYTAVHSTIKTKTPTTIILWVKDKDSKMLPPLKLEWKHSHATWTAFAHEFLYMSFEGMFGHLLKKDYNVSSTPSTAKCKFTDIPKRDLGNFVGELVIHVPPEKRISDYFNFDFLKPIDTETLSLSAKVPYYMDKKRVYMAKLNYQNPQAETVELTVNTNFNLVSNRDACLQANLNYIPKADGVVIP